MEAVTPETTAPIWIDTEAQPKAGIGAEDMEESEVLEEVKFWIMMTLNLKQHISLQSFGLVVALILKI